jgi:hypothetical protein
MKTAFTVLVGLMLMLAVSGCRCFGDRGFDTCWSPAPGAPVAATTTPPQVAMQ